MKNFWVVLLCAMLLSFATTGCNENDDGETSTDTDTDTDTDSDTDADTDTDTDTEDTDTDSDTGTDTDTDTDCTDGCLIDTICWPNGALNPINLCEICDTSTLTTDWSDNDGFFCDDGAFCTVDDVCLGGVCDGTAWNCSDDIDCNGVESCDETNDECVAGTTTCVDPEICDAVNDQCVSTCPGCLIDDTCYGEGQVNPLEVCQFCNTSISTTTWSDNDGAFCDDGNFCTGADTCQGGTCSLNAGDPCEDDGFFCTGTESCNEEDNICESDGNPCTGDDLCMEADNQCCVPNVAATESACNADGDVTAFDNCGYEFLIENCSDTNGSCMDGTCGCAEGYGGNDCNCVLYVNGEIGASGDGSSWGTAFQTVQEGIDAATVAGGCAVWVKGASDAGLTYAEKIILADDVLLYGGFAGDETIFADRNVELNKTILDAQSTGTAVTYMGEPDIVNYAVLDGFTITGGSNSGMRLEYSSPQITGCTITGNTAANGATGSNGGNGSNGAGNGGDGDDGESGSYGSDGGNGGGIHISSGAPQITNCIFSNNQAGSGGNGGDGGNGGEGGNGDDYSSGGDGGFGGFSGYGGDGGNGGAVFILSGASQISNCTFASNQAGPGGNGGDGGFGGEGGSGGFGGDGGSAGPGGFGGNGGNGGAIFTLSVASQITNCTFASNQAGSGGNGGYGYEGGGAGDGNYEGGENGGYSADGDSGSAGNGGGVYNGGTSSTLSNCILWGNTATGSGAQIHNDGTLTVNFSDVQGGWSGTGTDNIDSDPLFIDSSGGNLRLNTGSPCINAGNNTALPADTTDLNGNGDTAEDIPFDLDGNDRVVDTIVDMGAYEFWVGCGNYVIESGETCDDGNTEDGDGCSAACASE